MTGAVEVPVVGRLEARLRDARDRGRKLLVPYVTGGLPGWERVVEACAAAGADTIEVGIPFSDPVMDGPTIQEASERALRAGATPPAIVDGLARLDTGGVPLVVMTYYNVVFRQGHERFASSLARAGAAGAIVPDLPLEEVGPWAAAADAAGVETILLAAPTASDERLARICARSRGWVYGVGLLGVTGERDELAASALAMARRLKAVTDKPVLVGVGVSTPEQAAEVAAVADGVIVGSALVRRLLEGGGPETARRFVAALRAGLDGA
ncbi:MAG TPA: tryptophan synthase subunit alpha [Acidimicrobiales bacterium]|nr:tryptophan synthase subunit alpha [Acidimicrobiales bacterium]